MSSQTSPLNIMASTSPQTPPRRTIPVLQITLSLLLLITSQHVGLGEAFYSPPSAFHRKFRGGADVLHRPDFFPRPTSQHSVSLNKNIISGGSAANGTFPSGGGGGVPDLTPPPLVEYIAETNLPTDIGHFRLRAYRINDAYVGEYTGKEPCVIYASHAPPGDRVGGIKKGTKTKAVPVRIHDQCMTSEVFGSQRCDCKEQLKMSLQYIKEHGGAIIYLQQEGRGIGIANKVAAYALQDAGFDTVDANLHLGLPEDARNYDAVSSILEDLGIESVMLMTNNPRKVEMLRESGIDVQGTIPMVVEDDQINQWNRKYLTTKVERMDHANFGELGRDGSNFILPTPVKNGMMLPKKKMTEEDLDVMELEVTKEQEETISHALDPHGALAASAAISSALTNDTDTSATAFLMNQIEIAKSNPTGYCFGKQTVLDAVAAIARGEIIVVVDDADRENEGDFICAADSITAEKMAVIVRYSSGVVCVGMEGKRMDELKLPAMVENNEDAKATAFSCTVDATQKHGITTGISARDRAKTLKILAGTDTVATDLSRPGHIFPLRADPSGTLGRDGHTEASVDFCKLAGKRPMGVLCEIVSEESPCDMMQLDEIKRFCARHGFVLTSIMDLIQYRKETGLGQ